MAEGRAVPMVGREAELARMLAAYRDAAEGSPRVVVLGGEAGIGKSRLVAELGDAVRADGGRALVGACLDLADGGLPLAPLAEVMRSLDPGEIGTWGDAPLPGTAVGTPDEPLAASRLYEGTLGLLGELGTARPLVLAIEDVHWIDRATRDLVTFLVRNLTAERLLLVLTARSEDLAAEIAGWLVEVGRHARVERIELERLGRGEVRRQLGAILGSDPGRARVDRIFARSDGNPLVVEELAAADPTQVPASLRELTTARLSRLGADARDVVRVVAIGGRSIDESLVAAVVDRPVATVRSALREAVGARILRPVADSQRIGFRHAIVREVAAEELLAGERASLHGQLARILAERPELAEPSPAGAAAELAYHWEAAGDGPRALLAAIDAGDAAARVAAWADAARQFDRAIRLAARADGTPEVDLVDLRRRASEAAELDGDIEGALRLAETALSGLDTHADPERAAWIGTRIGYLHWALGDTDASLDAYERSVALLPASPSPIRARALGSLANALFGKGRYRDALDAAGEAVAVAVDAAAGPEEARARNVLGSVRVAIGEVDAGLAELERSCALAAQHGPADMRVIGAYNLAVNLAMAGRLADAERASRVGREAARAEGYERRYGADLAALEGDVLTRLGRWDEAHAVMEEAIARDPDGGRGTVYLVIARARLHALRGDVDEARAWLDSVSADAGEHLDADVAGYLARCRAELALVEGRPAKALLVCRDGLAPLAGTQDHFVRSPLLVLALSAAADAAEAARAARDLSALDDLRRDVEPVLADLRTLHADAAPVARALAAQGEAEWGRVIGESDPDAWHGAADALAAVPDPHAAAWARLRGAEATLRQAGVRADVAGELRATSAVADELGAAPLRRAVEELARRARVDLAAEAAAPAAPAEPRRAATTLSAREVEVLRLVADGRTNGEIAEALFITRKTAGVHVTHILDKLGVGNRVEAAMAAGRLGLLDDG